MLDRQWDTFVLYILEKYGKPVGGEVAMRP